MDNFIPAGYQLHLTLSSWVCNRKTIVLSGLSLDDVKKFISIDNKFIEYKKLINPINSYFTQFAWDRFLHKHKIDLTTIFSPSTMRYNRNILQDTFLYDFITKLVSVEVYYVPTRLEELSKEFRGKQYY